MRSLSASTTFDLRLGSLQVSLVQQLIIIIKVMMIKVIMIMVRLLVVMMILIKMNIMKSAPTTLTFSQDLSNFLPDDHHEDGHH